MAAKRNKKVRVSFRKNRQKRSRSNNLTRQANEQGVDDLDVHGSERLSGKGDLSRRRTIIGTETESGDIVRDISLEGCLTGRVMSAIGLHSIVKLDDGRQLECTVRRVVRTMSREGRNAVVAGDRVVVRPEGDEKQAVIERVDPRHGVLSRMSRGSEHVIASNIDQVVIIASASDPQLKPSLIDRFLISAQKGETSALICINKADLVDDVALQPILGLYTRLGYPTILTSVADGRGIERLRSFLAGKASVLSGQSGVGKSSLLNLVDPELALATGEVSSWTGKGKHTTRRATMVPLTSGGWVFDTPGIRQFGLWNVQTEEVEGYFSEFRPYVARCRFPDCTHTHETGCGVKDAVDRELISEMRYESYLKILRDDDD